MKLGCPVCLNVYDSEALSKRNDNYSCPMLFCDNKILDEIDENLVDIIPALWSFGYVNIEAFSGSIYKDDKYLPYINFCNLNGNDVLNLYKIATYVAQEFKTITITEVTQDQSSEELDPEEKTFSFLIISNDFNQEPIIELRLILMNEFIRFMYELVNQLKIKFDEEDK